MKLAAILVLALLSSSCAHKLTAPVPIEVRFNHDLDTWDWEHHTEGDFWEAHPEYVAWYTQRMEQLQ